jgi:hypothetical protein
VTLHHYKDQLVNDVYGIIAVYSENHRKKEIILCRLNAKLLYIEAGGIYSCH